VVTKDEKFRDRQDSGKIKSESHDWTSTSINTFYMSHARVPKMEVLQA